MTDPLGTPGEAFWEPRYRDMTGETSGRPSAVLVRFVEGRAPGRALDLGCARGDDCVWLARQGWHATRVDVSAAALEHARANAGRAGVAGRTEFHRHDLTLSVPNGRFDLVSALFLESPVALPRADVIGRVAPSIRAGGLLLVATHASVAPWSWSAPGKTFPTPEEELAALRLDPDAWTRVFVGALHREATGPDGQTATVSDNVIALERRA